MLREKPGSLAGHLLSQLSAAVENKVDCSAKVRLRPVQSPKLGQIHLNSWLMLKFVCSFVAVCYSFCIAVVTWFTDINYEWSFGDEASD